MTTTDTAGSHEITIGVPWQSPALIAILSATLMAPIDVPLISPALPEVQALFGVTESRAGLLITLYALPGILLGAQLSALSPIASVAGTSFLDVSHCLASPEPPSRSRTILRWHWDCVSSREWRLEASSLP